MEQQRLSLRVFKRSRRFLVLLWRKQETADILKTTIEFQDFNGGSKTKLGPDQFQTNESAAKVDTSEMGDLNGVGADTVIAIVREHDLGLDPNQLYYVTVTYGDVRESIRLTPAGVFPSHDKEDRAKNIHLFGWDDATQCWRKLSAVKGSKGQYYLGVQVMNQPEMMED